MEMVLNRLVVFVIAITTLIHGVQIAELRNELHETPTIVASAEPSADVQAFVKQLEARLADLEKNCCCRNGKPQSQATTEKKTPRERVKCYVYSTEDCLPCAELKADIARFCDPAKPPSEWKGKPEDWRAWTSGSEATNDFVFADSSHFKRYPTTQIEVDGNVVEHWIGKVPAMKLIERLADLIKRLDHET